MNIWVKKFIMDFISLIYIVNKNYEIIFITNIFIFTVYNVVIVMYNIMF